MSNEQLEFKIGEDEDPATVEMNEDGTEAKLADQPESPDVQVGDTESAQQSQELDKYSDSVKKRIDKLTARLRETERREAAALEYARSVQQKAQELEQKFHQTDTERLTEAKGRVETQAAALSAVIRQAREEGDLETEMEAQKRLTKIMMDQERIAEAAALREQQQAAMAQRQQAVQQQAAQQQQQPQRRAPDPRAEAWAERNEWYGTDLVMTNAVQGIHYQLVVNEQFDPESDEYYDELDRRMSEYFPQKLGQQSPRQQQTPRSNRPAHPVAPANRSMNGKSNARRTVKLTPSQVAIAKRLGVPLEEYAKYVKE